MIPQSSPTVSPFDTTIFTVAIFDSNGCSIIDSTIVNIKSLPVFDLGPNLSYCLYDSIELNALRIKITAICGLPIILFLVQIF